MDAAANTFSSAQAWRRALEKTAPIAANPEVTLPSLMAEWRARWGDAPALLSDAQSLSYRELAERADAYARWALDQGIAPGDVVGLVMANCPEYMAVWLGITRVGGIVALINSNLVGDSLRHSITVAAPRHIIVGADLAAAVAALLPSLDGPVRCWTYRNNAVGFDRIDEALAHSSAWFGVPPERRPTIRDTALYIYTSGTTGLPKAARVSHARIMQWSHWFAGMLDIGPADRMYNCLPMYHSVGGVVATGAALVGGASVVVREKFSASRFWDDVAGWDCTLFQYIGELCRYLTDAPPHPRETQHRLRLACGNGLRGDVWTRFQQRFAIPHIVEFYAATEGSFSLYNCDGKPGAIGRIPPFLAHRFPVALVRFDIENGVPIRGADGLCERCAPDEIGEAIARIADDGSAEGGRFEGYTDEVASERKILRNVFAAGDRWYRTGDLMTRDRRGYFYFVDRVGDTFRWKGENVSTLEVAGAVMAVPGVAEAVVYGVAIPGRDGRAGMAAITPGTGFDAAALRADVAERLPDYARPVFLRLLGEIAVTGTFKPQKQHLAAEGFDPAVIHDKLFVFDPAAAAYVPLDAARYRAICDGTLRL